MEWVIAILGIGCLFFAFQIVMDYLKYRAVVKPRVQRLEVAKEELRSRIEAAKAELGETRENLEPVRGEIDKLEQEYRDLQQQIVDERAKNAPRPIRFRS